jgi:hypothetical protein
LPKLTPLNLPSLQFSGLFVTFTGLFLMGGSSRSDVQSLMVLTPLMILSCGAALLTVKSYHWREHKGLAAFFSVVCLFVALYLLPLSAAPADFFSAEVGRGPMPAIANLPVTQQILSPSAAAWQSLFSLSAPTAVLLWAMQLNRNELSLTVTLLIFVGTVSGIIGVLQLAASASGPLYFYSITNNGSAVGLFANRNHAAVLLACLFPMLAALATQGRTTNSRDRNTSNLIAVALSVSLIPLILVTGSRSGMLAAIIGLFGGMLLYISRAPSRRGSAATMSAVLIVVAVLVLCLVSATLYYSRAEAIERLFGEATLTNGRSDFWKSSLPLFWRYFPLGFGPGLFVPVFQEIEPTTRLGGVYLNRLHNDWLETALTFGVPGVVLMLAATIYYFHRTFILWMGMDGARSAVALGRMASVIMAILAIASVSDYPLRTPAMAGFAALVLVWFTHARREARPG